MPGGVRAASTPPRRRDQHCMGLLSPAAWPEEEEPQLPVESERCSAACISSSSCKVEDEGGGKSQGAGERYM